MSTAPSFGYDLLTNYLLIGATLLVLGMLGFLTRRNLIVMFLSVELMLQGVAVSLVGFGRFHGHWGGQVFTIIILTVAACEAAISLALVLVLFARRSSLDVTLWQDLREVGTAPTLESDERAEPAPESPAPPPELTPAGVEPPHRRPWEEVTR